jgi:methyl-accepting chemotaxis protein
MASPSRLLALLSLLLCALGAPAHAAPPGAEGGVVPLTEGWRYRWGDGPLDAQGVPAWASESGEGEGWLPMRALQVPPGRGTHDFLWLSIPIPPGDRVAPALFLGSLPGAFEVYVGGRRVDGRGQLVPGGLERVAHASWSLLPLPHAAAGARVLLRVQSRTAIGAERAALYGEHPVLLQRALREGVGAFLVAALMALVACIAAAVAVRHRERVLVALALFCLSAAVMLGCMSGVPSGLWGLGPEVYTAIFLGSYFVVPALAAFMEAALLAGRLAWFRRAVDLTLGLAALLCLALLVGGHAVSVATMLPFVSVALLALVGTVAVAVREALRGSPDARLFVTGLGVFAAFMVLTALPSIGLLEYQGMLLHWGLLALMLSLLAIVGRRVAGLARAQAAHARELEARQRVVDRLVERLASGASQLSAAAGQLRTTSGAQNEGVSRQAAAIQEAQVTAAQIRQTSRQTAESVRGLAEAAGEAETAGRAGEAALTETLEGLEVIRVEVGAMARRLGALEGRTRELTGIVDTVKRLASQSNMLALNAAVEAVRTGEHGKGFAVVAREVRSLADQSIGGTERIREILDAVAAEVREAAAQGASGEERVRRSVEVLRGSGEQLRRIAQLAHATGAGVRQISQAVGQQDAGTGQIAGAIGDLSAQMERTLQSVQEMESVTRTVHGLAEGMASTVREHSGGA